jgi:hypothetical protein
MSTATPGIFVSGLVWVIAGQVTLNVDIFAGMATLFFGGMTIHPLSVADRRRVYQRGKPALIKSDGISRCPAFP